MAKPRVLFADDEPGIRATLPQILDIHGFEVTTASNVVDALWAIQSEQFDVLLTDLNIGEPGDGFTLVSAMRRTQPEAITIIITGYPAFETALQAIRSQVDDYLVKPTDAESLVGRIQQRLRSRERHVPKPLKRLSYILEENLDEVQSRFRKAIDKELSGQPAASRAQPEVVFRLLQHVLESLRVDSEQTVHKPVEKVASDHDCANRLSLPEARILRRVIYKVVQENLLTIEVSWLISDLAMVNELIDVHVKAKAGNEKAA